MNYRWQVRTLVWLFCEIVLLLSRRDHLLAAEVAGTRQLALSLERCVQLVDRPDLLQQVPQPADWGVEQLVAFEENWSFLYFCGVTSADAASEPAAKRGKTIHLVRKVFVLKPSYLVVDDQVSVATADAVEWSLTSPNPLQYSDGEIAGKVNAIKTQCRPLLPAEWKLVQDGRQRENERSHFQVRRRVAAAADRKRIVHLLAFGRADPAEVPMPACTAKLSADGMLRLECTLWDPLTATDRITVLDLPEGMDAGKVHIFDRKGHIEVPTRPLAAGLLPLGEEGLQLRRGWDIAYRAKAFSSWDTGHHSSHLQELVDKGVIRKGRTVDLGCGSGSDAVYLAGKGFDVTGIDISPAALILAEQKSEAAKVNVTWMLADVLAPPPLQPFDFVYDRGCYHEVRRRSAAAYAQALWQITRPGSRILILAGNAREHRPADFRGPPRVTEDQIRADFARGFQLQALREFRFDAPPGQEGALAWSILLERQAER